MQFHTQKSKGLSEVKDWLVPGGFFFFNKDLQCAETVCNNNWGGKGSGKLLA